MRYEEVHDGIRWVCIVNGNIFTDSTSIDMFAVSDNRMPISSVCHTPEMLAFEIRALKNFGIPVYKNQIGG